jgi:hypothetical protein
MKESTNDRELKVDRIEMAVVVVVEDEDRFSKDALNHLDEIKS